MDRQRSAFIEHARKKGATITFDDGTEEHSSPEVLHLDMTMVELSIKDAIAVATVPVIKVKLERLLASGTDAQKVDFVHRQPGSTYYFPEDLEAMAQDARGAESGMSKSSKKKCEQICHDVCVCLKRPRTPGGVEPSDPDVEQRCRTICKTICSIID